MAPSTTYLVRGHVAGGRPVRVQRLTARGVCCDKPGRRFRNGVHQLSIMQRVVGNQYVSGGMQIVPKQWHLPD
jgi:hypothetical protein